MYFYVKKKNKYLEKIGILIIIIVRTRFHLIKRNDEFYFRLDLLDKLAKYKMNSYLYAPKVCLNFFQRYDGFATDK